MHSLRMWTALLLAGLMISPAIASIRETHTLREPLATAGPDTLVILDLDDTVFSAMHMLGSDSWLLRWINKHMKHGRYPQDVIVKMGLLTFGMVHKRYIPDLVELETPQLIAEAQQRGALVIAETARRTNSEGYTHQALDHHGIKLSPIFTDTPVFDFEDHPATPRYSRGVVLCNNFNKGNVMLSLLSYLPPHAKKRIRRVVAVDDNEDHVKSIVAAALDVGLEVEGWHFKGTAERRAAYREEIADIQLESWPQMISDEEAMQILEERARAIAQQAQCAGIMTSGNPAEEAEAYIQEVRKNKKSRSHYHRSKKAGDAPASKSRSNRRGRSVSTSS